MEICLPMPLRLWPVLPGALIAVGCTLFGPPTTLIEGWIYAVDERRPLPRAEVCAFGIDTTCVRANAEGHYRIRIEDQIVVLRFRYGSLPPAASDTLRIVPPGRLTVNCGLTSRLVLTDNALPCQPVPERP